MFLWQLASQIWNQERVKSRAGIDKFMRICASGWGRFLIIHRNFVSEHVMESEDTLAATLSNILSIKRHLIAKRDFAHRQKLKVTGLDVWIGDWGWATTEFQHSWAAPVLLALVLILQPGSNFTCCWLWQSQRLLLMLPGLYLETVKEH